MSEAEKETCQKRLKCGHICEKLSHPETETCGPCTQKIERSFQHCTHKVNVRCGKIISINDECPVRVPAEILPECGHEARVVCKDRAKHTTDQLSDACRVSCSTGNFDYGCGHPCQGACCTCLNGRFHERCVEPCGRTLICGHICQSPCRKFCQPCENKCETVCPHGVCSDPCGVPCGTCLEPCAWVCKHQSCRNRCEDVCDRSPCKFPCENVLPCGHNCITNCGEPCSNLCKYCDYEKLLLNGYFDGRTEIRESDKFVFLIDCGHTIELENLNNWLTSQLENGEISLKGCPLCRGVIWTCFRFQDIIHRKFQDMIDVKISTFGSLPIIEEKQGYTIRDLWLTGNTFGWFDQFKDWLLNKLITDEIDENGDPVFRQISQQTVDCLAYLTRELITAERRFQRYNRVLEVTEYNILEHFYREGWYFATSRGVPLTLTEIADLDRQFTRINDLVQLIERRVIDRNPRFLDVDTTPGALYLYNETLAIIRQRAPYTETARQEFVQLLQRLDGLVRCQLGITDFERIQIVRAFGGAVGRWFKCPNGHIYVVTECGGPTEVGNCNECGAEVGGDRHQAASGNQLASEMDGATAPLYPTVFIGDELVDIPDPDIPAL